MWRCQKIYLAFLCRRYGALDSDRFCFEGGSRCGKGEGVHVIAIDQRAEFVKENFDLATKNRLENKRKGVYKSGCKAHK